MRRLLALLAKPVTHLAGDGSPNAVIGWWSVVLAVSVLVIVGAAAATGHLLIGLAVSGALLLSVVPVLKRERERRGKLSR